MRTGGVAGQFGSPWPPASLGSAVTPDNSMYPSHMSKNPRLRLVLVCAGALGLGFALVFLVWPRPPVYWAFSAIMLKPYTNAVFARPFETQMIKSIPALRKVTVSPGFATVAAAAGWSTNKVITGPAAPVSAQIRIMVLGSSPQEAQNAANDAATQLCAIVQRQYGGSALIVERPTRTGRWLFLYELKLRLARLLRVDL